MLSSQIAGEQPRWRVDDQAGPLAIAVEHLTKRFRRYSSRHESLKSQVLGWIRGRANQFQEFEALRDVSFNVPQGQMLGMVGANGAGKTTMLRVLAGIVRPDAGRVRLLGRVSPLLELGAGFAGELSGRRNVYLYGALLGFSRAEITQRFDAIADFAGVGDFLDTPIKHYSSGMLVRLAFAVAAQVDPDILMLDEVLAVGDVNFQAKCLGRLNEFRAHGKTIVLVTHSLGTVLDMCDRAILIDHGQLIADGAPADVVRAYRELTS